MAKQKLIRFAQNKELDCLIELDAKEILQKDHPLKGKWCEFFKNSNDLVLELGCGKGEYTVGLAEIFPQKNFIGVDIKGSRLHIGASYVNDNSIPNAAFIRTKVDFVDRIFANEVDEIWVTFPDPFHEKHSRRLTSPFFLERYYKILKPGGIVNLKTDDQDLYEFTRWLANSNDLEIIQESDDLYSGGTLSEVDALKTAYELKFLEQGKKIYMLKFVLNKEVAAI